MIVQGTQATLAIGHEHCRAGFLLRHRKSFSVGGALFRTRGAGHEVGASDLPPFGQRDFSIVGGRPTARARFRLIGMTSAPSRRLSR